MFHFNTVERVLSFHHSIMAPGIDHCYDCSAEVQILTEYHKQLETKGDTATTSAAVTNLVNIINTDLLASNRYILLEFNSNYYNVRFTDMQLGVEAHQIFTSENR